MTLKDIKKKVLSLIEELNPNSELLTDDPDIAAKINYVVNQVQFELARMKKIPANTTVTVKADEMLDLNSVDDFYQLRLLRYKNEAGEQAEYELIDNLLTFPESGTAIIYYYKFPKEITSDTPDTYTFELTKDSLEILPYGVAADLLKSDVSAQYGAIYSQRYETMLQRLDPRYAMDSIYIEGGVNF